MSAWVLLAFVTTMVHGGPGREDATTSRSETNAEWQMIEPGGDTDCGLGDPYRFFYHEADPTKLLVWFQGGGACWEWVSCSGMFDTSVTRDELHGYGGIFDFDDARNPFADYSVLFVPYCTGDVHVGDTVATYGGADATVTHAGYRNVAAALGWLADRVEPSRLVVSGASAGSYGAVFWAPYLARAYPDAAFTLIGDSGVPLLPGYPDILARWGAAGSLARIRGAPLPLPASELTLERAFAAVTEASPDAAMAHVTSAEDRIQGAFYMIAGSFAWRDDTFALLDSLPQSHDRFRSFVVEGGDHGLLRTRAFYAYEADGVRLVDWVAQLIDENDALPASRRCAGCPVPATNGG